MLRVVLDTTVFVSSVLVRRGLPAQVLDAWRALQYVLVISPAIITEIRSALNYPRIRRKYGITDEDVEQLVALLDQDGLLVPGDVEVVGSVPEDPKDEMVLACALEGQAALIVSGDRHLLDMGEYRGIPILTVREFLERLAAVQRSQ